MGSLTWIASATVVFCVIDLDPATSSLLDSLLARRSTLSTGTVRFDHFEFRAPKAFSDELVARVQEKGASHDEVGAFLRHAAAQSKLAGVVEETGVVFYRGDDWRVVSSRAAILGPQNERERQAQASDNPDARVVKKPLAYEIAYNGEYVTILEDGSKLIKRSLEPGADYTRLSAIDVAFLPWNQMRAATPLPGETASVSIDNDTATLKQSWGSGGAATWVFSIIDAFAPKHVAHRDPQGKTFKESNYRIARMAAHLPVVETAVVRDALRDGTFQVNVWLISEWSPTVAEADLVITTPKAEFVELDERFGPAVPKVAGKRTELTNANSRIRAILLWSNVVLVAVLLIALVYRKLRVGSP